MKRRNYKPNLFQDPELLRGFEELGLDTEGDRSIFFPEFDLGDFYPSINARPAAQFRQSSF